MCLSICKGLFSSSILISCEQTELLICFESNTPTFWPHIHLLLNHRESYYMSSGEKLPSGKEQWFWCVRKIICSNLESKRQNQSTVTHPTDFKGPMAFCGWILLSSCQSSFPRGSFSNFNWVDLSRCPPIFLIGLRKWEKWQVYNGVRKFQFILVICCYLGAI